MNFFNSISSILKDIAAILALLPGVLAFFDLNIHNIIHIFKAKIPKGFLIFITGTNGVGKTTTALKVQKKLGLRYIHVNVLREALCSQEELYKKAGDEALYKILREPTYLLDNPVSSQGMIDSDFQKQCEILGPVITKVAKYYYDENLSTVLEGINISPQILKKNSIPSSFALFINLCVTDKSVLENRLDKKAGDNANKKAVFRENIDKIIETGKKIYNDFASIDDKDPIIKKLTIDNTTMSVKEVTNKIIKEVRYICNQKK